MEPTGETQRLDDKGEDDTGTYWTRKLETRQLRQEARMHGEDGNVARSLLNEG